MPPPKKGGASASQKNANQQRLISQGVVDPVTGLLIPGASNYGNAAPAGVGGTSSPAGPQAQNFNYKPPTSIALPPDLGFPRQTTVPPRVDGAFLGLNMAVDASKLSPLETPWAVNVTGLVDPGNIGVRRGVAKTTWSGTLNSTDLGVCAVPLFFRVGGVATVLRVVDRTGTQYEAGTLKCLVPRTRDTYVAPAVALTSSAGNLNFTVTALTADFGVTTAYFVYSTLGFPRSPWADSDLLSESTKRAAESWATPASNLTKQITPSGIANATTVYASVWLASRIGFSPPWRGTVVFAT